MTDYDAIVIGAGNGGLTAAAVLSGKGLSVLVLEKHNIPGGSATSFCRGRFEFEVALHQLSGMGTDQMPGPLRNLLSRINVYDKLDFIELNDLYTVQIPPENLNITLRPNRGEMVAELVSQFPHEKKGIEGYIDFIYRFFPEVIGVYYMKDPEVTPEKYPLYFKYALASTKDVIDQYIKDPVLKCVLSAYWTYIGLPPDRMNFSDMAAMIFGFCEFKPSHIKGGSQAMSNAIADTIITNNGTIRYNCGAKKIIVRNGAIQGVVTDNDEEITAKYVVSNVSKISTYVDLMDQEHVPDSIIDELKQISIGQSAFIIYMGFDCEPEEIGITESTNFIFNSVDPQRGYEKMKSIDIDGQDGMLLTCYDVMDSSFSPEGASQATLVTLKYGEPWLRVPPAQYADKKYECADDMLKVVEKTYPDLRKHIEEIEVATPITCMRYLGHPKGSIYGFDHLIKDSEHFVPNTPHIKGLYGVGGWFGLCGFQPTLESGVNAARAIIKDSKA